MNIIVVAWRPQIAKPFFTRFARDINGSYNWVDPRADFFSDADAVKQADLLLIWNGMQYNGRHAVEVARRKGIPHLVFELGLFGQNEHYLWDTCGFNGESSMMQPLTWVTPAMKDELVAKRHELQEQHPLDPQGHVLVPLQIHNDTQVLYHTPYATMEEFQDDLAVMYPNQEVVIRPHPKSKARRQPRGPHQRIDSSGTFLEAASRASVVVGLTSSCLWEASILGVPTISLGDNPLRHHPRSHHDTLAAAVLSRNMRQDKPIVEVMERLGINLETRAWAASPGRHASTAAPA